MLGIPRSLLAPHINKKDNRFYSRNNAGKFILDVYELKKSFLQADEWESQSDNFRRTRIMDARSKKILPNLNIDIIGSSFLHIIPLGLYRKQIDLIKNMQLISSGLLPSYGWPWVYNLDGLLGYRGGKDCKAFLQFFRNGAMEFYSSMYHKEEEHQIVYFNAYEFKQNTIEITRDYFKTIAKLDISPPFVIYFSILDLKGIPISSWSGRGNDYVFDRDEIILPGILINSIEGDPGTLLQPAFDMLWQSCGFEKSPTD
jgi:hypothetical protein